MRTKIITGLKKELLVIELPEWFIDFNFKKPLVEVRGNEPTLTEFLSIGDYTLLGKPDEIKDEEVKDLAESWESVAKDGTWIYENYLGGRIPKKKTALESFNSALESEIFWDVNPLGHSAEYYSYIDDERKWHEAQEKTFDKKRTLIFVKN